MNRETVSFDERVPGPFCFSRKQEKHGSFSPTRRLFCRFQPRTRIPMDLWGGRSWRISRACIRQWQRAGGYDGVWNVLIITQAGRCDAAYSYPFQVAGGRISSAGAATVSGSVGRGGGVAVRISAGGSVATGSGRLGGSSGAGRWNANLTGGNCSGRWQATRG
jgi:hypothetical protein